MNNYIYTADWSALKQTLLFKIKDSNGGTVSEYQAKLSNTIKDVSMVDNRIKFTYLDDSTAYISLADFVTATGSQHLSDKTIDGDENRITNIAPGSMKRAPGAGFTLVSNENGEFVYKDSEIFKIVSELPMPGEPGYLYFLEHDPNGYGLYIYRDSEYFPVVTLPSDNKDAEFEISNEQAVFNDSIEAQVKGLTVDLEQVPNNWHVQPTSHGYAITAQDSTGRVVVNETLDIGLKEAYICDLPVSAGISSEDLSEALKNYPERFKNKVIDVSENSISNITTRNFKPGIFSNKLNYNDFQIPTGKAVIDNAINDTKIVADDTSIGVTTYTHKGDRVSESVATLPSVIKKVEQVDDSIIFTDNFGRIARSVNLSKYSNPPRNEIVTDIKAEDFAKVIDKENGSVLSLRDGEVVWSRPSIYGDTPDRLSTDGENVFAYIGDQWQRIKIDTDYTNEANGELYEHYISFNNGGDELANATIYTNDSERFNRVTLIDYISRIGHPLSVHGAINNVKFYASAAPKAPTTIERSTSVIVYNVHIVDEKLVFAGSDSKSYPVTKYINDTVRRIV